MTYREATRRIKRSDLPALRAALDDGLDPNLANRYGWTLLMAAALEGVTSVGRMLIAAGAKVDGLNAFRDSPLTLAIHNVHPRFVQMLLQHGASLEPVASWESQKDWFVRCSNNTEESVGKVTTLLENTRAARSLPRL